MKAQGTKQIGEAVLISALSALCGAIINYGVEKVKAGDQKRDKEKERIAALEKELADLKAAAERNGVR